MGSSTSDNISASARPSPEFLAAFTQAAAGRADQALSFAEFMELALYHPTLGYYRREQLRVGRTPEADFYTATSSGPIFGELVTAAAVQLLDKANPAEFTFIEIGAEPTGGVLSGVTHPFGATRTVRVGEVSTLTGKCVVFSNELFDAQPLRRLVRAGGKWHEFGVQITASGELKSCLLTKTVDEPWLPTDANEGYVFDAPRAAVTLAEQLAAQPWEGVFIAFDYGKSSESLANECPEGTLRAYHRHRQSNDLLANPGLQDLTGHVCWDWLEAALAHHGFTQTEIESQEAFFVKHSGGYLSAVITSAGGRFDPRKLALMQLLHPGNLGQKFQVLHARRDSAK